ncbi:MAG: hypothetical protein E7342_02275 [Clostridiales bacterium]|nr:hypothetical protein [Clostridiales bacterium]
MKKRLLGLVSIICLLAVIFSLGAFTVSADSEYDAFTTLTFESLTVGTKSTGSTEKVKTGNTYFDEFYPRGGTVEVMEESGEKFVRTTANGSSFVAFVPCAASKAKLPATDYRITITYRLSDPFTSTNSGKNFAIRSQSSGGSSDEKILANADFATSTGTWNTKTVISNSKGTLTGYWLFAYVAKDCYFDIKEIKFEKSSLPVFDKDIKEFDARNPEDVTIDFDLSGKTLDGVDFWNEDWYEYTPDFEQGLDNPSKVREPLDQKYYTFDEENEKVIISKDFLATLTSGQKSVIFEVGGLDYAVIINILHSDIHDTPISLGKNPAGTDTESGCGSVITATSAVLASALLAGAVVVLKKKH